MSRKVLLENDCDCSIYTSFMPNNKRKDFPKGWALNLKDIREFIPVLRFEFECYIRIRNIISPCRIRVNPRLFYKGTSLRNYLKSQRDINQDKKFFVEIKFNKKELYKSLDEFDSKRFDYIDTKLLVGKSYRSKGWGLAKDVVSKIIPLDAYNYVFPVYIEGIPAETRLNMQTRLFYSSHELSKELEKLYKIDPKQKVGARIILNEEYLNISKLGSKDHFSERKCIICGNFVDEDSQSNKCFDCLDKEITVFKLKKLLEFINPYETLYENDLLNLGYTKGQIKILIYKFEKYGLISINWDGSFQFKDKSALDEFIKKWG